MDPLSLSYYNEKTVDNLAIPFHNGQQIGLIYNEVKEGMSLFR